MNTRVLFATSEMAPWVRTGGLAEVSAALPAALAELGLEIRVLLPAYPALLRAFRDRQLLTGIAPFAGLPAAHLSLVQLKPRLSLLLLECPVCFERVGNPYVDAQGKDWGDNLIRFALLSRVAALLASSESPLSWKPDIVHCNDWQSGLAPAYLRYGLSPTARSLITVHNLAFTGLFGRDGLTSVGLPDSAFHLDGVEFHGHLSFLKAGLQLSDRITTVSPSYAREIMTPAFGWGLDGLLRHRQADLRGILNGIDLQQWNPASDALLPARYSANNLSGKQINRLALLQRMQLEPSFAGPLLGCVCRLTAQKGIDLILDAAQRLIDMGCALVLLGSGEKHFEQALRELAQRHPSRVAVEIGFDDPLAHLIEAGADLFLMPSRFEPCGLNQMYSQLYGTPPVVCATGGLADTVCDCNPASLADGTGNGFVLRETSAEGLIEAVGRAIALRDNPSDWLRLQRNGMRLDHSWRSRAQQYVDVYNEMLGR